MVFNKQVGDRLFFFFFFLPQETPSGIASRDQKFLLSLSLVKDFLVSFSYSIKRPGDNRNSQL